jgi:hypothetical protein
LLITLTPRSRAEDVSDAEDRQATQFHDRLFRRTDDTTALAAVKVIKPASVPAPVFNTGLSAASAANFPTTRCHFFFRRNKLIVHQLPSVAAQARVFARDAL